MVPSWHGTCREACMDGRSSTGKRSHPGREGCHLWSKLSGWPAHRDMEAFERGHRSSNRRWSSWSDVHGGWHLMRQDVSGDSQSSTRVGSQSRSWGRRCCNEHSGRHAHRARETLEGSAGAWLGVVGITDVKTASQANGRAMYLSSYWNKRYLNQLLPQNNKGLKGHLERFEFFY